MKDDSLDNLLARGRMGGRVREHILEEALRNAEIIPPPWYERRIFVLGSPALAALALLGVSLVLRPTRDTMRAKGDPGRTAIVVSAECGGMDPNTCTQGDTLLFRLEGVEEQLYVA